MADLLVDSGKHRGRKVKLAAGDTLIGREKACAIRLATAEVSRKHCRLTVVGGEGAEIVTAEDLGSRNGTFVNGHPITAPTPLSAGDTLRVGPMQFRLPDPDAASESEVVNWLVPPPAAGTVAADEPTATDLQAPADPEPQPEPPAEPEDEFVRRAAEVIRERHAGLAAGTV